MPEVDSLEKTQFEELQQTLTEKWRKAILTKDGKHKRHVMYGDARMQELDGSSPMLYVCGIPFSVIPLCECIFSEFDRRSREMGFKTSVVLQNNLEDQLKKWRREYRSLTFVVEREDRAVGMFARTSNILALGILPAYFTLRENQHVAQLCRGLEERVEEGVLVRALTSRLLNTDSLIVTSEDEREFALDTCNLKGIYQGRALCVTGDDLIVAQAVCAYVLDETDEAFSELDTHTDKKRVAIYCRTYEDEYWRTARRIIGATDLDVWDVTLIVPNNIKYLRIRRHIDALPERVRVISREPTFPCGAEDYVHLQIALDSYSGYDTFDEWFGTLGKDAARIEAQRLLGRVGFDAFIYVGELSSLWSYISSGIDATTKKKIELSDFVERQQEEEKNNRFAFDMELEADAKLFDEISFFDEGLRAKAKQVAPEISTGLYELPVDSENSYQPHDLKRDVSWGDNILYLVIQFENEHIGFGSLIEVPEVDEAYLVEGKNEELLSSLSAISKSAHHDEWVAVAFDAQSSETEKEARRFYASHASFINDSRCLGLYTIREYLKLFSGVIVPDEGFRSCLRISADAYGIPVFYPTDKGLVRAGEPLFESLPEVERYVAYQCARLYCGEIG